VNPLYLTEGDVAATFTMHDALNVVEDAARALAEGRAENKPRQRAYTKSAVIQVLAASYEGRLGHKTYTVAPKARGARFWVLLFDEAGQMLAMIEADRLGQMRTGAASGIATRYLAREDAKTLAVIGTGWQAQTQLEACVHARPITRVLVYGRDAQRRTAFCELMSERIDVPIQPAETARDAVAEADVICTMTSSNTPVLEGAWLKPGAHVNAAGSNRANAQEIDIEAVTRASVVAVEDIAQAKIESGDLRAANETAHWSWEHATRLSDIVAGHALGRTSDDQITLFESLGIGLWDVAAASFVFDKCVVEGRGTPLPIPS
jgi:ornithine cyclodeaminase/alanine dehydrogenase-like protein (mu-crystallin family)